ncbi:MAG: hypothetical protein ACOCRX_06580 [Candidatus Woesearchaeota archaeon]
MESHSFQKQFKNMGIDKNRVLNADNSVSDDYSSNSSRSSHKKRREYVSPSRNQNNDALINKMFNTLIDLKRTTKKEIIELKEENKSLLNEIKILKRELSNINSNSSKKVVRNIENENSKKSMTQDSNKNNSHNENKPKSQKKQATKKKSKSRGTSRSDFSPEEISIESHFNFNK